MIATPIICLLNNLMNLYYITVCIGVNNKLLVLVLVHVTIVGTPCIDPNSRQDYCSKKTLYLPDTASFIIRTAVLIGGFLPHAHIFFTLHIILKQLLTR